MRVCMRLSFALQDCRSLHPHTDLRTLCRSDLGAHPRTLRACRNQFASSVDHAYCGALHAPTSVPDHSDAHRPADWFALGRAIFAAHEGGAD